MGGRINTTSLIFAIALLGVVVFNGVVEAGSFPFRAVKIGGKLPAALRYASFVSHIGQM